MQILILEVEMEWFYVIGGFMVLFGFHSAGLVLIASAWAWDAAKG